jgi:hypothetical protein
VQHFITLVSLFTLHVSAFIGHLQMFYLLLLKLLLVLPFVHYNLFKNFFLKIFVIIFPHRVTPVFFLFWVAWSPCLVPPLCLSYVVMLFLYSGRLTLHSACGCHGLISVLSQHLPGRIEERHEKPQQIFKLDISLNSELITRPWGFRVPHKTDTEASVWQQHFPRTCDLSES